jgi:nitrate/nitrite-specific signal transduction histidine kinase
VCVIYLAVIERVRQWTTRRLVRPVQELADVAIKAMEGEEVLPQLEQSGPAELKTLAHMLGTFVDTLKGKVRQRTAELERQKANLEREVASRRQAEDQLRHAAFHDELTGLCNRDLLLDRLDRCICMTITSSQCSFSTSIVSRRSTTASVTLSAISCSSRSPSGFRIAFARATP